MLQAWNFTGFLQQRLDFVSNIFESGRQQGSGIHPQSVMNQERRNSQGTNRQAGFLIFRLEIVVNIPVDARVHIHVHFCIVQRGDPGQYHGRSVCLHCMTRIKIVDIFEENADRDLFIGVVTGQIDSHHRYKLDFRMSLQNMDDLFFVAFVGLNNIEQFF